MSHFDDNEARLTGSVPGPLYHPRPGRPYTQRPEADFGPVAADQEEQDKP